MNDQQLAKVQVIAATADCNFDHDAVALGYVVGIRNAVSLPNNKAGVRQALVDLATHLDGKESAAEFVEQIDDLVDDLG